MDTDIPIALGNKLELSEYHHNVYSDAVDIDCQPVNNT